MKIMLIQPVVDFGCDFSIDGMTPTDGRRTDLHRRRTGHQKLQGVGSFFNPADTQNRLILDRCDLMNDPQSNGLDGRTRHPALTAVGSQARSYFVHIKIKNRPVRIDGHKSVHQGSGLHHQVLYVRDSGRDLHPDGNTHAVPEG